MMVTCHKCYSRVASTEQPHHVKVWSRRVDATSLVTKIFDSLVTRQHNHDGGTKDQGIDFSTEKAVSKSLWNDAKGLRSAFGLNLPIFLSPFLELPKPIFQGHLVQIPNEWKRGRSRRTAWWP